MKLKLSVRGAEGSVCMASIEVCEGARGGYAGLVMGKGVARVRERRGDYVQVGNGKLYAALRPKYQVLPRDQPRRIK